MQKTSPRPKPVFFSISLLVLFVLIPTLTACSGGNGTGNGGKTPTPQGTSGAPGGGGATPSATPGIPSGVQPCPGATKNPAYWTPFITPQAGVYHVENVTCASIMDTPALQALVTVRHSDDGSTLDAYIFNNITSAKPTRVFQLNGMVRGQAKISAVNTLLTAQADELSALNQGKPVSAMTADLYREFAWSAQKGALVQTVFSGIFPDLTRWQAEADQAQVNQGHQPWKLSATMVANALAVSLLNWSPNSSTTLLSGGGAHDASAVVRVRSDQVVSGGITVTLSRLEGNTNGGIWEATAVTSDGMSITYPAPLTQFINPVQVKGTGSAFEGRIGQVILLDHLYHSLGQASATGAIGNGRTSFSTALYYQSTFPAGVQEGVLVLSARSNANGSIAGEVMEKVLINGALESAFAVQGVDLTVSPNSIAGMSCGSTLTLTYTATFHVQAGTAGGTIQFLYTWNNGHASPSGSVTVAPNGPSAVAFTYTATGRVGGAYAFPGVAQVNVTSPNAAQSSQVIPAGQCS